MSHIFKNSYYYTLANVVPQSIGFLFLPIYSLYMAPSDFGIVSAMEAIAYILTVVFCLGLDKGAQRFYFDGDSEYQKRMLSTFFIATIILSVSLVLLSLLAQSLLQSIFVSIPFFPYFILAIMSVSLNNLSLITTTYYQVSEQPKKYMLLKLLRVVLQISLTLVFVVWLFEGAEGHLKAEFFSVLLFVPIYLIIAHKNFGWCFDKKLLVDGVSYSWPFIPTLLMAWILNLSDRFFLERYVGLTELGIYSMGYKVSMAFFVFSSALTLAYTPIFYRLANSSEQSEAQDKIAKCAVVVAGIFVMLMFFMSLFAKEIFNYFLDASYEDGYIIVRLVVIGHCLSAIMSITSVLYLLQAKKTKLNMIIATMAAVANIALNFLLIPSYGIYGAAFATLLSLIILTILQYHVSKKGYFILFPWVKFFIVMVSLLAVIGFYHFYLEDFLILSITSKACIVVMLAMSLYYYKGSIQKELSGV